MSPPSYTIVPGSDHPKLYSKSLLAKDFHWIDKEEEVPIGEGLVSQIRHRQEPVPCRLRQVNERDVEVIFENERGVYGVTPGQAVAVWLGDRCIGGGIISN
jgi:tRNA-uridine 2-sulfurtransferase